jgi:hypothetical protein
MAGLIADYARHLGFDGRAAVREQKFPEVLYDPEYRSHWISMHDWCRQKFGEKNYTWAGNSFFFESQEAARWFKIYWVWQLTHQLTGAKDSGMAYAVRFSDTENFWKEKQFMENMNIQAHAGIDHRNFHLSRWCLLPDNASLLVYARLLSDGGEVVDLREYDLD